MLSKSIQNIIPDRPFHRAIDETLKIPETFWPFLCLKFIRVLQFSSTSHAYKIVITTVRVDNVSVIRDLLSISVRRYGDFVARFCQPSRMTSFK